MTENRRTIRASKFLSLTLRHKPQAAGLTLDAEGWAEIDALILGAPAHLALSRDLITRVVAENDKKRFQISEDGLRIRAVQGHSLAVDLRLQPIAPPRTLFHGTASRFLKSISAQGLLPGNRLHVHLSQDYETAFKVGARYGAPVVLEVKAEAAYAQGQSFFRADNGVWLTGSVAAKYLSRAKGPSQP